ncbi:aminoglycoside phosphotransferase [Actinosynnema sp. NPDC050436]|uniref:aminoglycoside phosphotransferase n=1 Tax=Actinosynnema sp. NPDC050436 TaxID=3155659 RepID=UPI003402AD4F
MSGDTGDADERFREWMRDNLARAAAHFGLVVTGEPRLGWLNRSISAPVRKGDARYWLRVVSEDRQWTDADFWTGNLDANALTDLAKPCVLDVVEWEEWRQQRAEVMTRMPGVPCSPTDALRTEIELTDEWWAELRHTTDAVATTPTGRVNTSQDKITERLVQRFGNAVDPTVHEWETVHGDVHWANLLRPRFGLVDWEWWGRGPSGTDAATLLCYSLLTSKIAQRVHAVYADVLDTDAGRVAQLYIVARLLRRADGGEFADLIRPLEQHARTLLGF